MKSQEIDNSPSSTGPLVSVVLATYNEARSIESCLVSILSQQTSAPPVGEFRIEVLVVDGMSTDGTRAIVERYAASDARVRIIDNTRRRAPFAFNLGLQHAHGEYVCIFGAHTLYRDDYIAVCLGELLDRNAAACGGRVKTVPASGNVSARLAAWTMGHPFGSSSRSFRTQSEGPVDTVNYAVFRRDLALAAGGYNEELLRNQDNDMNQKLRALGFPLWCTWKTQCHYFPKATVSGLIRYGYGNGFWNALSVLKNPAAMGLRHFVPFLFLIALELSAFFGVSAALLPAVSVWHALLPFAVILGMHLAVGTVSAIQVAVRDRAPAALLLPPVFLAFHLAYGFGTLRGFLSQPRTAWFPSVRHRRDSVPSGD